MVRLLLKGGLSANKQTEADNGTGDTFETKRLVFDHITLHWHQLLLACGSAKQKYSAYSEKQKV